QSVFGDLAREFAIAVDEREKLIAARERPPIEEGLVALAAGLRPSLIAPSMAASWLLRDGLRSVPLTSVREYCSALAEFSDRGHAVDPAVLRDVKDSAATQNEARRLQRECEEFRLRAKTLTFLIERATDVWRTWLHSEGVLHSLLNPVEQGDVSSADRIRRIITQYRDPQQVDRLVDATDRHLLGKRPGRPIEAR